MFHLVFPPLRRWLEARGFAYAKRPPSAASVIRFAGSPSRAEEVSVEALAWKRSIPFCYGCYRPAPSGRCESCMSDDLMRLVQGVGCEYGIEWVVEHLVMENLTPVDLEEAFADSVSGCYPETVTIGWIEYDTVSAIKELDPVSWDLAKSEMGLSDDKSL